MTTAFFELILFRAWAELLAESKRSYAGLIWWLVRPLFSLLVYGLVFGLIFTTNEKNHFLFLFTGIVTWEWFSSAVLRCTNSILINKALMSMVKLEPALFPISICLVATVKFFCGLTILLLGIAFSDITFELSLLATLPLVILCELILCIGCGLMVSAFTPLFPDIFMITTTGMQMLLFLSGIFYKIDRLPDQLKFYMRLNPVAVLLEQYRNILLYHTGLSAASLLYVISFGIVMGGIDFAATHYLSTIYTKRW